MSCVNPGIILIFAVKINSMRSVRVLITLAAILSMLFPLKVSGEKRDVKAALQTLDSVLARKSEFADAKRVQLDSLQHQATMAAGIEARFNAYNDLFNGYRSYSMDTALIYARKAIEVAEESRSDSLLWYARLLEAEGLKGIGEYNRALSILDAVPGKWRDRYHQKLLNRYCSIYYSLSERRNRDENEVSAYGKLVMDYRDSLMISNSNDSPDYWLNKAERCRSGNDFTGCLVALDSLGLIDTDNTIETGVVAYIMGSAYAALGNYEAAKYWLAVSATADISGAVRKYESLQELANILSMEGDYERAYNYITCAITDIRQSNARSRMNRIAEYLPIITQAYTEQQRRTNQSQTLIIVLVSMLAGCLIVLLLVLDRKNRRIATERAVLESKNSELVRLQTELSAVNRHLEESAKVKEEYVGYLFNLCLEYIDANEHYRSAILLKLRTGKPSEVENMLNRAQDAEYLQSFFRKFDSVFLDIFPDFIERMNSLMSDGYRMEPREGELLSPELRIYALVRLGITDSTKIANFLHYSNQTVYNYRHRVRTHAGMDRQQFVDAVMAL